MISSYEITLYENGMVNWHLSDVNKPNTDVAQTTTLNTTDSKNRSTLVMLQSRGYVNSNAEWWKNWVFRGIFVYDIYNLLTTTEADALAQYLVTHGLNTVFLCGTKGPWEYQYQTHDATVAWLNKIVPAFHAHGVRVLWGFNPLVPHDEQPAIPLEERQYDWNGDTSPHMYDPFEISYEHWQAELNWLRRLCQDTPVDGFIADAFRYQDGATGQWGGYGPKGRQGWFNLTGIDPLTTYGPSNPPPEAFLDYRAAKITQLNNELYDVVKTYAPDKMWSSYIATAPYSYIYGVRGQDIVRQKLDMIFFMSYCNPSYMTTTYAWARDMAALGNKSYACGLSVEKYANWEYCGSFEKFETVLQWNLDLMAEDNRCQGFFIFQWSLINNNWSDDVSAAGRYLNPSCPWIEQSVKIPLFSRTRP
jgi:hypothetical protein